MAREVSQIGRAELVSVVRRLRQHLYEARPETWVADGDHAAAQRWQREAAELLGLMAGPQRPQEPRGGP